MKKILSLLLVVVLVFSLTAIVVSAQEPNETFESFRGETVTIVLALPQEYQDIKGGSVEFEYDESVFEFVESKWIPKGLTVKNYNAADKKGVFAASSKTYSGDIFELQLRVSDAAFYAEYTILANVQLQNGANEKLSLQYAYNVSVAEYIEVDDPTTPADFVAAVNAINTANPDEATYNAICVAMAKYNALTEAEKAEVSEAYSLLLSKVSSYNNTAAAVNTTSKNASSIAFSAISNMFAYLSKLLEAFRQMIWK